MAERFNEQDYSIYMPVIAKLLRYILFPQDIKKSDNCQDDIFQDIVYGKHDELHSENVSTLNTNIKIKTELLRHLMLTHRWKCAAEVLSTMFLEIGQNSLPVYQLVRVALEIKYQLGLNKNLDSFIQSAIAASPSDAITIELDRFLHEVAIKFENGLIIGMKNSSSSLENFAVNLRNARHNSTGRRNKNTETIRKMQIDKLYAGAISYIQAILSSAELDKIKDGDNNDDEMKEEIDFKILNLQETVKTHVQNADNYFQDALKLCPVGPWDSFINMHVDLVQQFKNLFPNHKETIQKILETFCDSNPLNKNGWKLLANFLLSLKQDLETDDDDIAGRGIEILEKICEIDCFDETGILLVKSGLSKNAELSYLFQMLDGFQWKNDLEIWQLLAKELIKLSSSESQEDKLLIEREWLHRSSWWPKYHFQKDIVLFSNIDFLKASVAGLLLGRKNRFFKRIWKEKDLCKQRDFQNLLIISYNLNKKVNIVQDSQDSNDDDLEFFTFNNEINIL